MAVDESEGKDDTIHNSMKAKRSIDALLGEILDKTKTSDDMPDDFGEQMKEDYTNLTEACINLLGVATILNETLKHLPEIAKALRDSGNSMEMMEDLANKAVVKLKDLHFADLEVQVVSQKKPKEDKDV